MEICSIPAYNYKKNWNLIQKQPNCKKGVRPPRRPLWKKYVKSKVAAKNGCDGRLIAKILIMAIQMDLVLNRSETWRGNTNSAELSLSKFLLLAYHHSHSWPPPWISHIFSQWPSWGPHPFLQLGCFWIRLLFTWTLYFLPFSLQLNALLDDF